VAGTQGQDTENDLIDPADFRSFEIHITSLLNETTRTAVKDGSRIFGGKKSKKEEGLSISFLEFLENGHFSTLDILD
jgi:hypothetical protein